MGEGEGTVKQGAGRRRAASCLWLLLRITLYVQGGEFMTGGSGNIICHSMGRQSVLNKELLLKRRIISH